MLRIRLKRVGARNQPSYRIVVADSRKPRDGAFVDHIGHYNPRIDPPEIVIDSEKAQKWINNGAQPSDAVRRMLESVDVLEKTVTE
ncbi:MAG: 30S ribosomal protein S16 [SAR202 cluster bacterium]|nr:30S ribosomal protein S16 [Chloroflexota bacterium]MQG23222.1 30S ribosomal protein S16 [SAR202 cluster bacterium]|tara:strand:- start:451 stop:708 length:258 start_codon:yes stop_codon:yes gene_type:complete